VVPVQWLHCVKTLVACYDQCFMEQAQHSGFSEWHIRFFCWFHSLYLEESNLEVLDCANLLILSLCGGAGR
jgi:hypothetical protein